MIAAAALVRGLLRARGVGAVALVTAAIGIGLWFAWGVQFAVSTRFPYEPRGVGAFEVAAVLLAAVIPPLTASRYGALQVLASTRARMLNAVTTVVLTVIPFACLPIWLASAQFHSPSDKYPPIMGYFGSILLFAAIGQVLFYFGGVIPTLLGTPTVWILLVVAQQGYREVFFLRDLARGNDWHTGASVTITAITMTLLVAWFGHSVPRTER